MTTPQNLPRTEESRIKQILHKHRGTTHWEGCEEEHDLCYLMTSLHLERLRADGLEKAARINSDESKQYELSLKADLQAATAALADPVDRFTAERVQVAAARQYAELLELQVQHYRCGWLTGTEFCEYGDQLSAEANHASNRPDR